MKVYLKYIATICSLRKSCHIDWGRNFYLYSGCLEDNCDDYINKEPKISDGECQFVSFVETIICKEAKSIVIVKDEAQGFVRIGRKQWPMDDIILLKVDYGDGWVVEIEEDENNNEV
jgi:hypothetical protein